MEFKLLVVDDEPAVTAALSACFLDRGYRVLQAGSGDEALALLEQEPVDAIILDLHMPGIAGEDVLRQVKASSPSTKVVVVTAYPDRESAVQALGCDGFVAKPLVVTDLLRLLDTLLVQKDEEELQAVTMGPKLSEATSGDPLARLLLVEPAEPVAHALLAFLGNAQKVAGHYQLEWAPTLPHALTLLVTVHPDLVLLNVSSVRQPAEVVAALLASQVQPKTYLFYMRPKALDLTHALDAAVATWWEGNPWQPADLQDLARLVRQAALAHGLVKR